MSDDCANIEPRKAPLASEFWQRLGVRIAFAGGVFPVLVGLALWGLVAVSAVVAAIGGGGTYSSWFGAAAVLVGPLFYGPLMFAAGFIYTALITMATLPVVATSVWLMGLRPSEEVAGRLSGGLIGWIGVAPFILGVLSGAWPNRPFWAVAATLIGVTAIVQGMACGSLAGLRSLRAPDVRGSTTLTLRVILGAVVPLSIAATVLKALDQLTPTLAVYAALGLTVMAALTRPTRWAVNAWLSRRLHRRRARRRPERDGAKGRST